MLVTVEIFESLRPLRIIFLAISIRGSTPLTQKYFYTVPASQYFQSLTSRPGETMIPESKERIQPLYSLIQRLPACLNNPYNTGKREIGGAFRLSRKSETVDVARGAIWLAGLLARLFYEPPPLVACCQTHVISANPTREVRGSCTLQKVEGWKVRPTRGCSRCLICTAGPVLSPQFPPEICPVLS